jgi:hypothetical protein
MEIERKGTRYLSVWGSRAGVVVVGVIFIILLAVAVFFFGGKVF